MRCCDVDLVLIANVVMQKQRCINAVRQRKKRGVDINGCGKNEHKKVSKLSKMLVNMFQN